jgi:hypothetical protein
MPSTTVLIVTLVVYVLAVARLTRLVNADIILDPLRVVVARRYGADSTASYFLGCPWCVGLWLALLLAIPTVAILGWPWWSLIPLGLACSHIVGLAAPLASDEEIDIETVEVD